MVTLVNRAKVATATTGTGTITLGSAESGYQTFADAGVVNSDVVRYVIEDGTDWEIGTGTYTATGTTLSRTVLESSNADAALNLTGSAVVYVSATAEDIPPVLELYAENPSSPTAPSATGTNAVAIGSGASATNTHAISIGRNTTATGIYALSLNGNAVPTYSAAIGYNSAGGRATTATGQGAMALGGSYASGTDSFAAAITNNTSSYGATGANSVAIGYQGKATAFGAVSLGRGTQATANYSLASGINTVASALYGVALGFESTTYATTSLAFASGSFSGFAGQHQARIFVLRNRSTDATPKVLVSDGGSSGSTNDQIILPNNSAYAFHGTIVARQQASQGTACAAWKIEGLIRREGSVGTTVLVNSATTVLDNTPGWGMTLSADTTNGGLKIEVTGAAATNIAWNGNIHTSEVTY
jgi:hypothetical protein